MKTMHKRNLAVIKSDTAIEHGVSLLYPNTYYRTLTVQDGLSDNEVMIDGTIISVKEFNEKFEYAHDRLMRHWENIGLRDLHTGKPISRTAFGKLADVHTYTGAGRKLRIYFFGTKDCKYGFYPMIDTKANNLKECYQMYLDTFKGITEHLDCKDVQFGNCGIPLSYGDLRVWKTTPSNLPIF
jgi:hypothetical protein